MLTVDDAGDTPEQQNNYNSRRRLTLVCRHTPEKDQHAMSTGKHIAPNEMTSWKKKNYRIKTKTVNGPEKMKPYRNSTDQFEEKVQSTCNRCTSEKDQVNRKGRNDNDGVNNLCQQTAMTTILINAWYCKNVVGFPAAVRRKSNNGEITVFFLNLHFTTTTYKYAEYKNISKP